jgi:hypothetical protein
VARAAGRGRLRAQWQDRGIVLENHLYRVEIHGVDDDGVTFKWSRENGTVVFPITDIRPTPAQPDDHGTLIVTVEDLERDPLQLQVGDWVELVDDVTVLDSRPLPLCRVTELDHPSGQVTLQAKKENIDRVVAETSQRELEHPLLRRWEDNANPIAPKAGTTATPGETWLDLEHGIQLAFGDRGTYQVGDYWLIPARTRLDGGIEWPKEEGRPLAQAPHGIAHHYAPLALLQFQEGEEGGEGAWSIVPGAGTRFHSLPQMTAQLSTTDEQLQSTASRLIKIQETLDTLVEQSSRIHAHIFQDFSSLDALEVGHVVAFDPSGEDRVTLASKENERLVVGVVTEPIDKDNQRCRVVLFGRVRCKVVGRVEPGDLLVVASDVRGYAEKGGWYLRPGTILGKALSDKDEETDTIDMLVTLG